MYPPVMRVRSNLSHWPSPVLHDAGHVGTTDHLYSRGSKKSEGPEEPRRDTSYREHFNGPRAGIANLIAPPTKAEP